MINFRVLVVGSEPTTIEMLVLGLEALGVSIQVADSAVEVLDRIKLSPLGASVDLMLVDDQMLDMGGDELIDTLRICGDETPYVLVSSSPASTSVRPVLPKPFTFSMLFDVVRLEVEKMGKGAGQSTDKLIVGA